MMELARRGLGKQLAHEVLYDCATVCYAEGLDRVGALRRDDRVTQYLTREEITALMDPVRYLGTIQMQIDGAVARAEAIAASVRESLGATVRDSGV